MVSLLHDVEIVGQWSTNEYEMQEPICPIQKPAGFGLGASSIDNNYRRPKKLGTSCKCKGALATWLLEFVQLACCKWM